MVLEVADQALNEGRGVNPGDSEYGYRLSRFSKTLNEGRGVNPGDRARGEARPVGDRGRSTKAGA